MGKRLAVALLGAGAAACASAPAASADSVLLDRPVAVGGAFAGPCFAAPEGGTGSTAFTVTAPGYGYLRLTLRGGSGDWDVAAFASGQVVAAAATSGADEVASGFALRGESIRVQVCRNEGASGAPRVRAGFHPLPYPDDAPPQLLRVRTSGAAEREVLAASGLDLTENVTPGYTDVVAFGPEDRATLARLGLAFTTLQERLGHRTFRAAPRAAGAAGRMPSGRTEYRRLYEYEQELKDLAAANPRLVRVFTLPRRTFEGRVVEGIELGDDPGAEQGEPVFLQLGLHHGREWPAGEVTLEWAYELLRAAARGSAEARERLTRSKTLIVPVVNPDGFNVSREAGALRDDFGARTGRPGARLPFQSFEYQRKNCRLPGPATGDCGRVDAGSGLLGVDVNRNYGGGWGGPGADLTRGGETYRGPGPFSEPETENVRAIFSTNQVIAALSQHTYAALMLRPPLTAGAGPTPDERLYARLGERLERQTGYRSVPGYKLYDTSGGLEDWSYYSTGAITYTPELRLSDFHTPYPTVIREWSGAGVNAADGLRGAFYEASGFVLRRSGHLVVRGTGPVNGRVIFRKSFRTATARVIRANGKRGKRRRFGDRLSSSVSVGPDGRFEAHLNPSTRPIALERNRRARERWTVVCVGGDGERTGTRRIYGKRDAVRRLDLSRGC